jgi:hypothetical protein
MDRNSIFIIVFWVYLVMYKNYEYRKVQGLIGETSFSVILPKEYAIDIGLGKGDFVKVRKEANSLIIEKA